MTYAMHSFYTHTTLKNDTKKAVITHKDYEIEVMASQVAHPNDVRCARAFRIARERD